MTSKRSSWLKSPFSAFHGKKKKKKKNLIKGNSSFRLFLFPDSVTNSTFFCPLNFLPVTCGYFTIFSSNCNATRQWEVMQEIDLFTSVKSLSLYLFIPTQSNGETRNVHKMQTFSHSIFRIIAMFSLFFIYRGLFNCVFVNRWFCTFDQIQKTIYK